MFVAQQRPTEPDAATRNTNAELERGLMHAAEQLEMVGLTDEANEVHWPAGCYLTRAQFISCIELLSTSAMHQNDVTPLYQHTSSLESLCPLCRGVWWFLVLWVSDVYAQVTGLWQAMTSGHLTADQIQKRARQLSALLVQSPAASECCPPAHA